MLPVVLGVDPALGGGFAVIACGLTHDKLWVLDCRIAYGLAKTEEEIERIVEMARLYRPHKVIIEYDAQQKGLGNDDRLRAAGTLLGFGIQPHLTRQNKNMDPIYGCASMDQSFRRKEISIPWKDDESRRRMNELVDQLRKWRPDAPPKMLRQDAVMALWFVWRDWMQTRKAHEHTPQRLSRPSWIEQSPTQWLRRTG